jgi:hypothetical protein
MSHPCGSMTAAAFELLWLSNFYLTALRFTHDGFLNIRLKFLNARLIRHIKFANAAWNLFSIINTWKLSSKEDNFFAPHNIYWRSTALIMRIVCCVWIFWPVASESREFLTLTSKGERKVMCAVCEMTPRESRAPKVALSLLLSYMLTFILCLIATVSAAE